MKYKTSIWIAVRWIILSIVMFIIWVTVTGLVHSLFQKRAAASQGSMAPQGTAHILLAMAAVAFINTGVLMHPMLRSRWQGVKLMAVVALEVFAVQFFMAIIEAIYFNYALQMPMRLIYSQLISGMVMAILFGFLSVIILRKLKKPASLTDEPNLRIIMPCTQFLLKFFVLAIFVYPLLYFLFGYLVAWQSPAVREFYTGTTTILPFFQHFQNLFTSTPYLAFWQMMRGVIWVLVALPVIRMMKGKSLETALSVGLIFALVMNSQHLIPNQIMTGKIRLIHFIETASSNFIWGAAITWLMQRKHTSFLDLFRRQR